MKPINFPESNFTFKAPEGMDNCSDLKVFRGHDLEKYPCIISKWELDAKDLAKINETKHVYLQITGVQQPPISLMIDSPFEANDQAFNKTVKDQVIDILTDPEFRGKVQKVLEGYGLKDLNDMHAQADIENLIKKEINQSNL